MLCNYVPFKFCRLNTKTGYWCTRDNNVGIYESNQNTCYQTEQECLLAFIHKIFPIVLTVGNTVSLLKHSRGIGIRLSKLI